MTQKQKADAYDKLIDYLQWSFDYWSGKFADPQDELERIYASIAAHEDWTALARVDATDGRQCPCTGCRHRAEEESAS